MLLTAFEFYNWAPGLDFLRRHISPDNPATPEVDSDLALGATSLPPRNGLVEAATQG